MYSDRAYLRSDYPRRSTTALVWIVATLVAAFVLQLIVLSPWFGLGAGLIDQLALTTRGLKDWHVWILLTHGLLHSTGYPFHILFTILALIFLGREIEPVLGSRRFLAVFIGAILTGGLAWTAVHWWQGGGHIGAGAGVCALLVILAGIQPQLEMSIFLVPVSVRIRLVVYVLLGLDALGLIFYELIGAAVPLGMTPSAHLGGMLAGWLYIRFLHAGDGWDRPAGLSLTGWLRRGARSGPAPALPPGMRRPAANLRAEVDRILDKINSRGFGSLTEQEKRTLDEAKEMLSKH